MAIVMATCSNCGDEYEKHKGRRGMCASCRRWQRKYGSPRPVELAKRNRQTPDVCSNCGDMTPGKRSNVKGLCVRCYAYKYRTGKDRKPKQGKSTICKRCKREAVYLQGRCVACYGYFRRHGKERPKSFFAEKCLNCKRPFVEKGVRTKRANHCNGLCWPCYRYHRKHGKPRPQRLINKHLAGSHGYCDCGKQATHIVMVTIHQTPEPMPLCTDCYAEHKRQVAWYGDGKPTGTLQQGKRLDVYGDD